MAQAAEIFEHGFVDPVHQAQQAFRGLMEAMSRPGTIVSLPEGIAAPAGLSPAQSVIALTLCDADTPIFVPQAIRSQALDGWLAFHAGAACSEDRLDARFAFLPASATIEDWNGFSIGSLEYPDRSVTLVVDVTALSEGDAFTATGPGIEKSETLRITGLPSGFEAFMAVNRSLYPRGVDVILTAGTAALCLPRTTHLASLEA